MGSSLIMAVAAISLVCIYRARGIPDTRELMRYCSHGSYNPLSDYEAALDLSTQDLIMNTARNSYHYFTRFSVNHYDCFGHAECRRILSNQDCIDCLRVADTKLISRCPFGIAASISLQDCYMRYDDHPFLEDED